MNLPSLPTDNLYKFLALFGLVLIVVGLFLTYDYPNRLYERLYELQSQEKTLNVSNNYSVKYELEAEIKKLNLKVENLGYLLYLFIAVAFIGGVFSSCGFYHWYYKLQVYSDEILKNEADKYKHDEEKRKQETENSKQVKVHHLQFEKEFEVYKELWASLTELKIATLQLRPEAEWSDSSKTKTELHDEKTTAFGDALEKSWIVYQKNKPFYDKSIFNIVDELVVLTKIEHVGYKSGVNFPQLFGTDEYWKQAAQNKDEIIKKTDTICDKIRIRIGLLELA